MSAATTAAALRLKTGPLPTLETEPTTITNSEIRIDLAKVGLNRIQAPSSNDLVSIG